jgi:periplasmic protein TonB
VRSLLIAASLILSCDTWSQAADPAVGHEADIAKFRSRLLAYVSYVSRYGHYPPAAREKGLEGDAVVLVAVDAAGRSACTIKSSSGHEALDQRALAIARYAASNVPIPDGLRGVAFSTEVRLRFSLTPGTKPKRGTQQRAAHTVR